MLRTPVVAVLAAGLLSAQELPPRQRDYASSVGIYHWAADRRIADAQGATVLAMGDRLLTRLGVRIIRIAITPEWDYFDPDVPRQQFISRNSCGQPTALFVGGHCDTEGLISKFRRQNLAAVLQNPQYTTIILTVFPYTGMSCPMPVVSSVCDANVRHHAYPFLNPPAGYYEAVAKEMEEFGNFLYTLPGLEGKAVILADWETDHNFFFDCVDRTELYVRWVAARQQGVTRARSAHPQSTMRLLNAVEIVELQCWRAGTVNALTALMLGSAPPFDLLSYSAYETTNLAFPGVTCGASRFPGQILQDVNLLDNLLTGLSGGLGGQRARLMFGEFGYALGRTDPEQQKTFLVAATDAALAAGVPRVVQWSATDNTSDNHPQAAFGLAEFRPGLAPDFFELRPAGVAVRAALTANRVTIDRAGCLRDEDSDNSVCNGLDWHTDNLLPGGFATVFGRGFGAGPRVELTDGFGNAYAPPVIFRSDTQVNFVLPSATPSGLPLPTGRMALRVRREDGDTGPFADFDVGRRTAPRINTAGILAARFGATPRARYCYLPGESIEIYGKFPPAVKVLFDGVEADPDFVHPQGWQINVRIPPALPVNDPCTDSQIQVKDLSTGLVSNPVPIHLRAPGRLCPPAS